MRHFIIQVKTTEIAPRHNLKCPKDSKYEEVEEPDKKIQQFLLWAHKTGLLAVWGPRRFVLSASAVPKFLTPRFAEFQGVVQALAAVSMDDFIAKDGMLQNLQNDLKYAIAAPRPWYIALEGENEPMPFERFLRVAVPGQEYHIGGVVLTFHD